MSTTNAVSGAKTILVVDDEDDLRKLVAGALRLRGHIILEASNCAGALDVCAQVTSIDVAVLDYNIPGGNGLILAEKVQQKHPTIAVMLMSGNLVAQDEITSSGFVCFQKPFELADLNSAIQAGCKGLALRRRPVL